MSKSVENIKPIRNMVNVLLLMPGIVTLSACAERDRIDRRLLNTATITNSQDYRVHSFSGKIRKSYVVLDPREKYGWTPIKNGEKLDQSTFIYVPFGGVLRLQKMDIADIVEVRGWCCDSIANAIDKNVYARKVDQETKLVLSKSNNQCWPVCSGHRRDSFGGPASYFEFLEFLAISGH